MKVDGFFLSKGIRFLFEMSPEEGKSFHHEVQVECMHCSVVHYTQVERLESPPLDKKGQRADRHFDASSGESLRRGYSNDFLKRD